MKKIILYTCLIMIPAISMAHNTNHEMVHQYIQQNVMPVLLEKRQAFDAFLTSAEQNELATYRGQLNELFENRMAIMREKNESVEQSEAVSSWKEYRTENHEKVKAIMERVQAIADRHEEELSKIFSALEPQKQQWKSDISKLVEANENQSGEPSSFHHYNYPERWPYYRMWSHKSFLLLNPSQANSEERLSANNVLPSLTVFPNPATDEFTLNLVGIPSQNKLVITDMVGNVVKVQENALPAESISCNEFANGIYFVELYTDGQTINKKIIVNHN